MNEYKYIRIYFDFFPGEKFQSVKLLVPGSLPSMKFRVYFHELSLQNSIMADTIPYPVPVEDAKHLYVRYLGFKDACKNVICIPFY
jgi:hypothetical protein